MKALDNIRKAIAELRGQLANTQAEIEVLESEKEKLTVAPIRFDCWKAAMFEAIDAQAQIAPKEMLRKWRLGLRRLDATDGVRLDYPQNRFCSPEALMRVNPFFDKAPYAPTTDAGLNFGWMLTILHEPLKKAFAEHIEPLRESWPLDVECGPKMTDRQKRLVEIETRLAELNEQRDAFSEALATSTS
ncbi:MAG: hypothetical protein KDE68_08885 [Rhodocyclaceae bacterium]|nr:hypothetical protein [Rhodocyclaceae bacterium]